MAPGVIKAMLAGSVHVVLDSFWIQGHHLSPASITSREHTVCDSDFSHRSYTAASGPARSSVQLPPGGIPQPNAPATRLSAAMEMSLLNARHVKYALLCTRKANIYWLPKSFLKPKASSIETWQFRVGSSSGMGAQKFTKFTVFGAGMGKMRGVWP